MKLIFDAHLDIAWNALSFDRDQTLTIQQLRDREARMKVRGRGRNTVSLPELRRAGVGVCLGTILARCREMPPLEAEPRRIDLDVANQSIAYATAQGQIAYYRLLEQQGEIVIIETKDALRNHWKRWADAGDVAVRAQLPVGVIFSMEGADPIVDAEQAEQWFKQGLRTVCLAHYGQSVYAMGTGGDGPLTDQGRPLLEQMQRLGIVLDLVHTADTAFAEACDFYEGPIFVSHCNCRALREGDRQLSDDQIEMVAKRSGVVGVVLDAWMLDAGFKQHESADSSVTLDRLADHIDHICQIAGSSAHAGIGSDLDGGFGAEQTPADLETINDLNRIADILLGRGFSDKDVEGVMYGNFLKFFTDSLPD